VALLAELCDRMVDGSVEVIDLTAPLSERTPIIRLPPSHGKPCPFERRVISRYDHAGENVYWNNISLSEHTGTHFDAPIHWLSGRHLDDVSQVPARRLVGPAVVLDYSAEAAADPDFLLRREHVEAWQAQHGHFPENAWLLYRTGWDARRDDAEQFLNGGHTPGVTPECARWLAQETPVIGLGVETVGTDAGQAMNFDPAFPCHCYMQGANKYGLTQLQNLHRLPPRGAVVFAGPLPIVGGSGSPTRVLALVERSEVSR